MFVNSFTWRLIFYFSLFAYRFTNTLTKQVWNKINLSWPRFCMQANTAVVTTWVDKIFFSFWMNHSPVCRIDRMTWWSTAQLSTSVLRLSLLMNRIQQIWLLPLQCIQNFCVWYSEYDHNIFSESTTNYEYFNHMIFYDNMCTNTNNYR